MGSNLGHEGRLLAVRPDPQLARHIDDLFPTLEQIIEAGELARSLIGHPGWSVLEGLLDAEVAVLDRILDSGRPLEHVDYAARHGRRGGLKAPEQVLLALISRAESRLEEQRSKHEGDAETLPEGAVV